MQKHGPQHMAKISFTAYLRDLSSFHRNFKCVIYILRVVTVVFSVINHCQTKDAQIKSAGIFYDGPLPVMDDG